jgi:transcriptional regulator with XRE-family HTH domain
MLRRRSEHVGLARVKSERYCSPVEHSLEPIGPTAAVVQRVKKLRQEHGMSATALAAAMKEIGIDWERMIVTKLETGRRKSLSVVELLGLAYVLNTTPYELLVPDEDEAPYQVMPTRVEPSGRVRAWMRGVEPLDASRAQDVRYTLARLAQFVSQDDLAKILRSAHDEQRDAD